MIARLIIAVTVVSFATLAVAQHPRGGGGQQIPDLIRTQPNQPQTPAAREVGTADISAGIKKHIARETKKAGDKRFHINYRGKDLALDLIKVHDDRLSNLGGGKYFACVDMKATDGKIYDIDFFLTGRTGDMKVGETSVHKINGKPLYNWEEEGGVWKKVKA
jgi:hypothetical protein